MAMQEAARLAREKAEEEARRQAEEALRLENELLARRQAAEEARRQAALAAENQINEQARLQAELAAYRQAEPIAAAEPQAADLPLQPQFAAPPSASALDPEFLKAQQKVAEEISRRAEEEAQRQAANSLGYRPLPKNWDTVNNAYTQSAASMASPLQNDSAAQTAATISPAFEQAPLSPEPLSPEPQPAMPNRPSVFAPRQTSTIAQKVAEETGHYDNLLKEQQDAEKAISAAMEAARKAADSAMAISAKAGRQMPEQNNIVFDQKKDQQYPVERIIAEALSKAAHTNNQGAQYFKKD